MEKEGFADIITSSFLLSYLVLNNPTATLIIILAYFGMSFNKSYTVTIKSYNSRPLKRAIEGITYLISSKVIYFLSSKCCKSICG